MEPSLDAVEARITGVLIEKLLSTPEYYPLSVKALVAGANQKNARDPVTEYDEPTVERGLERLMKKRLVELVLREGGRADRYRTTVREAYVLATEAEMAVLAELLLRGPQTAAQVRAHAARMREASPEETDAILAKFEERGLVLRLDPGAGQRGARFGHTLSGDPRTAAPPPAAPRLPEVPVAPPAAPLDEPWGGEARTVREAAPWPSLRSDLDAALARIRALEARVAAIEQALGGPP